jgi:hypothetical protein
LPWCIVSSAGGNCITMFIHSQRLKKNILMHLAALNNGSV